MHAVKRMLMAGTVLACRQVAALLQLLNAMAGGRDVGTAVTITCQIVIKGEGHAAISPAVKRLAYDIVRGGALTDADWDNVLSGFLRDISPTYPSTEVSPSPLRRSHRCVYVAPPWKHLQTNARLLLHLVGPRR